MRDPFQTSPLRRALLQQALEQFPELDISAIEAHAALDHTVDIINGSVFAPLQEYGISRGRFNILMHLSIEEMLSNEAPSPSGIAENLGVTRATMTQLLDGLEHDQMIERRNVGHDRRAQAIYLTDEGRRLFSQIIPSISRNIAQIFAPLTPVERQTLIGLLSKLTGQRGTLVSK
jgi:DNA-binding MarR family transcriptional regulator